MTSRPPLWLLILFLVLLATATDEFVIAGVLPLIAADLGVSVAATGQLVTVFALVYALGAPTMAVACERLPRRAVMVGGLAVFVAANVVAALAPDYWTLLGTRAVAALAAAVVTAAAFATAAAGAPRGHEGRYLSVVTAGMTVALITGVPLGAWIGGLAGWRATFLVIAGVGLIAALGLLASAPKVPGAAPAPLRARLAPLANRAVLRCVLVTFLAGGGGLMFYSYLSVYAARVSSDSSALLTALLAVVGVAGLAGALLSGRWSDSMGPQRALAAVVGGHALALGLLAALVFTGLGHTVLLGALIALWAVFAWGLTPPVQGSVLAAAGPATGMTALALNIAALYLGAGAGGALGGLVIGTVGVALLPVAATSLMLASFLLTIGPARANPPAGRRPGAPDRTAAG
ncbi:putative MFS family arabinose efflux permease [Nocardiopsis sp. Huas11]|uniref:MFS transporter n=1 Tax=Nocardiopsis sp. Huas11 TaxID=2183912 RepID=UPI000EB416BD|nr:MFS transporter [Nocardiopsis sp. Huas11]RKS09340.1 putative MFS family arabinose efflux permease [Nocardiopsis sp. Huas11]